MCTWKTKRTDLCARCVQLWICSAEPNLALVIQEVENYEFTVQRCLKCQVALLLIWICSVGSGTSTVRVITVLRISFWHYSYFTSSNLDHRKWRWRGGGEGRGRGGERGSNLDYRKWRWRGSSEFFVLWLDCLMKSSTSYRNVHPEWKMKTRVCV